KIPIHVNKLVYIKVIVSTKRYIYTGIFFFYTSNGSDQQLIAGLRDCGEHSDTGGKLTNCH
ncbi:unnamed protein product, partial [Staurois parvus]